MKTLELIVEGATHQELDRGVAAAVAVIRAAGVGYAEVINALIAREVWDMSGFPDELMPRGEVARASDAWDRAERAAIAACCSGWPKHPASASLVWVDVA